MNYQHMAAKPNWRDAILKYFFPQICPLTLTADPDELLTEELLTIELRQRKFELVDFADPVEFRYIYETHYRSAWDRGERPEFAIILRLSQPEFENLPYDLLCKGRKLTFDLGSLFPHLSYPVLEALDRQYLDTVSEAQSLYAPERLGDAASMDFILRHVFGIAAELINTDAELLRSLLQFHYKRLELPGMLCQRLLELLGLKTIFSEWPLEQIVSDSEAFFHFLQERWPLYLNTLTPVPQVSEQAQPYTLRYPGPDLLPFEHHDVCAYIDTLFLEERLTPIELYTELPQNLPPWAKTGIAFDDRKYREDRAARLLTALKESLPEQHARYSVWLDFAMKWAELCAVVYRDDVTLPEQAFEGLRSDIDSRFRRWLEAHYASLPNLPPVTPAMVHHIPRYLAREMEEYPQTRLALIVVDGLALDQWVGMRQLLSEQDPSILIRESASFAWIPTLTSVSRQAIFAGKAPRSFGASLDVTAKEPVLWRQFWESVGLARSAIAYKKGLGAGDVAEILEEELCPGRTKVLGLVVDKVDKIMHGIQLGSAGMHNQIQQWAQSGFLSSLIDRLLDSGYQAWLTSDHGNIECRGQGRIAEGVLAESRGERVRIYSTPELMPADKGETWPPIGLPEDYYPLLAKERSAFITSGSVTVAHGGASLEEVIVPFVKFER